MPINGGGVRAIPVVVNAPERQGELAQPNLPENPAFQNNSKVGSRRRVEDGKAQYTWRAKGQVGLDAFDIVTEVVPGWRGEFNRNNISSIESEPDARQNEAIVKYRGNRPKLKYKSSYASDSAKTKNNWIIYVNLAKFYYNSFANMQRAPPIKYPQLISDPILQAMFHARDDENNDCPVPPDHYILFADFAARYNFEVMKNTIPTADGLDFVRVSNPFDMLFPPIPGEEENFRTQINNLWDNLFTNVAFMPALPPTRNLHYWPFRYANNVTNLMAVRHGVDLNTYNRNYRPPPADRAVPGTPPPNGTPPVRSPPLLTPPTPGGSEAEFYDSVFMDLPSPSSYAIDPTLITTSTLSSKTPPRKSSSPPVTPSSADSFKLRIGEIPISTIEEEEKDSRDISLLILEFESEKRSLSETADAYLTLYNEDPIKRRIAVEYVRTFRDIRRTKNIQKDLDYLTIVKTNMHRELGVAPGMSPLSSLGSVGSFSSDREPITSSSKIGKKSTSRNLFPSSATRTPDRLLRPNAFQNLEIIRKTPFRTTYLRNMERVYSTTISENDAEKIEDVFGKNRGQFLNTSHAEKKIYISTIFFEGTDIVRSMAREYLRKWPSDQQTTFLEILDEVRTGSNDIENTTTNTGFAPSSVWRMLERQIPTLDKSVKSLTYLQKLANEIIAFNDSDVVFHLFTLLIETFPMSDKELQALTSMLFLKFEKKPTNPPDQSVLPIEIQDIFPPTPPGAENSPYQEFSVRSPVSDLWSTPDSQRRSSINSNSPIESPIRPKILAYNTRSTPLPVKAPRKRQRDIEIASVSLSPPVIKRSRVAPDTMPVAARQPKRTKRTIETNAINAIPLRLTPAGTKRSRPFAQTSEATSDISPPIKITKSGRISQRSKLYSERRGGIYGTKL
jgi:hypothetical protein